jgi:hypothetical protein
MESKKLEHQKDANRRQRIKLAHMESDAAYFQARLEIIGDPETSNQHAQRRVFKLLYKAFGNRIVRAKQRLAELE